jgi:putative peptidoglycan lipid II flippase
VSNIGNNSSNGTIASILGALCIAIFARSVFHIASRGFYAYQDTKTPFIVSIIAIGFTILLSVGAYFWGWGVDGLGLAQSIGAILEIIILLFILQRRSNHEVLNKDFFKGFFRMIIATAITGCVAFSMTKFIPLMATDNSLVITIPKFLFISLVSVAAYVVASYFLNLEEAEPILNRIKKILFKNVK